MSDADPSSRSLADLGPHVPRDSLRTVLMRAALMVVVLFPFGVYLPLQSFASLVLGCGGTLLCARRLPQPPLALTVSTLILLGYLALSVAGGDDLKRSLSTSNHMFQWIFATYTFYTAFHNGAFEVRQLPKFLPYLALGHLLAAVLLALDIGQQPWEANPLFYEHNLLSFFTIFVLARMATDSTNRRALWYLVAYLLVLTVLTDRMSVIALNLAVLGVLFVRIPPVLLAGFALFTLLSPIYAALTISQTALVRLIDVDFNTYIRMEFIGSAASMLKGHLLTGVGFDTLHRSLNYAYAQVHPLLNDPEFVASVSNHHSFFDTVFRFGLILGPIFLWPILRQLLVSGHDRAAQAGILFQAFGLSFNAYFEQQGQITTVCFITALLMVENRVRHAERRGISRRSRAAGQRPSLATAS